jgi:hypothetical protein
MQVTSFSRQVKCIPEYAKSFAVYVTSIHEKVSSSLIVDSLP